MPRVLYIDDDFANRLLVKRVLVAEGFEVDEADNAADGIQLAIEHQPNLILMDIAMPEMNGLEATNYIRSIPGIAQTRIVAVTANAMQGDREMILEAGCDGYISKPINIDTFVDEISQFLT
ncbi:MAG: response regulator [Anaerolineae bacterium]|nr:response regulator [Anaerolineae bacterium]MDQ7036918.1 response regulator [Anaerolineae bacterium]